MKNTIRQLLSDISIFITIASGTVAANHLYNEIRDTKNIEAQNKLAKAENALQSASNTVTTSALASNVSDTINSGSSVVEGSTNNLVNDPGIKSGNSEAISTKDLNFDLAQSAAKLKAKFQRLYELKSKPETPQVTEEMTRVSEEFNQEVDFLNKVATSLENAGTVTKKFVDDFFTHLSNFISNLPVEQLFAFVHLCFYIALILLVLNLAFVFYGDSIIRLLNIEIKFPRLAKLINLRRKFQQYYFGLNLFVILVILLFLLYLNLVVFLS